MSESLSLGELVAAEHPMVAWPSDWAAMTKRLFTTTSAGLGQPTLLNSALIEEVLTCPGWWAGQREVNESELSMAGFRLKATRRVARRWLAENLGSAGSAGSVQPLTFTRQVLHRFAATDDLLGPWIRMMPAGQLAELRAEVAMGLECRGLTHGQFAHHENGCPKRRGDGYRHVGLEPATIDYSPHAFS